MRNTVGIMGTSLTNEQIEELERIVKVLDLCLDADSAGQEAMLRAERVAAGRKLQLRVVPLPRGKDPGDMILSGGADTLRELVEASQPFVVFRVDRILDSDRVLSAEDKDRAIGELRPVLGSVPESVLRDDLIRRAAARLDLSETRLVELLGRPRGGSSGGAGSGGGGVGGNGGGGGMAGGPDFSEPARPVHVDRTVHNEQSFLALCVALPDDGEAALAAIDADQLLTSEVLRRAARHLAGRLRMPFAELPPEDEELARAVADLVKRAGSPIEISADRLEHSRLLLELGRVDRAIKRARVERTAGTTELARERQEILAQIGVVTARFERPI